MSPTAPTMGGTWRPVVTPAQLWPSSARPSRSFLSAVSRLSQFRAVLSSRGAPGILLAAEFAWVVRRSSGLFWHSSLVPIRGLRSMNCLLQCAHRMIANRTVVFGSVLVSVMLGLGTAQGEAATTAKSTTKAKAKAKTTTSTKAARPLYSAERSLSRQAKLARARAQAQAREVANSQPRYKTDASGDLVPDVRAAAAIIYDPETNKVLWEENS